MTPPKRKIVVNERSSSDVILNVVAVLLAVTSATFAVVTTLLGPQTSSSAYDIGKSASASGFGEPIITGSIPKTPQQTQRSFKSASRLQDGFANSNYAIRTLINDVATIDFFEGTRVRTVKAKVGDSVSGIGLIREFIRKDGYWIVSATPTDPVSR